MCRYLLLLLLGCAGTAGKPLASLRGAANVTGSKELPRAQAEVDAEALDYLPGQRDAGTSCCPACPHFCPPLNGTCHDSERRPYYHQLCTANAPKDDCCATCPYFCSPRSGHCHMKQERSYYHRCSASPAPSDCCAGCSHFCSPRSGKCYDSRARRHYQQCGGPAAPPDGNNAPPAAWNSEPTAPPDGNNPPPAAWDSEPAAPPDATDALPEHGTIATLYHTTSPGIAKLIVDTGFKPGHGGWCGGAMYFLDYPGLPKSKVNPKTTSTGAIVEAEVLMGQVCRATRPQECNNGGTGKCCPIGDSYGTEGATKVGCNSIIFNPGDGDEYIIWNSTQVLRKRIYCQGDECKSLCRKRGYSSRKCR